jgi:hypothetical protein
MPSTSRILPLCRSVLLFVAMLLFVTPFPHAVLARSPLCSEICSPQDDCTTFCNSCGSSSCESSCGEYNGGQSNGQCYGTCGDAVCNESYENSDNCPLDCPPSCNQNSDCELFPPTNTCIDYQCYRI